MASQYRKIEDFPEIYWEKDSPVSLEKFRLAKDTYRGVNVLQLTFRNISNTNIYGLSISIAMKDFNGKRVPKKDIEYNYYGIEVGLNKTFGSEEYITVEPEAKSFLITVTRAEFSEGAVFRGAALLKPMPEPLELETLGEFQEPFTQQLLLMQPKVKVACAPEDKLYYWRCTCSRFYNHTVGKCPVCNLRKDEILDVLKDLKNKKREEERLAALLIAQRLEEEEKARIEAEEKRKQEEALEAEKKRLKKQRRQKICAYAVAIITLLLIFFLIVPQFKQVKENQESSMTDTISTEETPSVPETTPEPESEAPPSIEPSVSNEPEEPVFESTPLAVLGQDLTDEDLRLVLRLIGMEETDFDQFDVIYVSSEEEISYLSGKYSNSLLGGRSLSSLLITPTEPGSGLNVVTYNITYCTVEMYSQLLEESGITDADVVVAAPFKMSGTAALAGIMKAGEYFQSEDELSVE